MRLFSYSIFSLLALTVAGCVSQPQRVFPPPTDYVPIKEVQIQSRFPTVEVTGDTLGVEANRCVPQLNGDTPSIRAKLKDFPNRNIVSFEHMSSANMFILRQTTAVCLQRSSEKFPIFASEAFLETANPKGVPPDVTEEWYKKIALLIASKGSAKIAYVFDNGNAFSVSYWVEVSPGFALDYSSVFRKAGTWEAERLDAQFSHPSMTSVAETKRSGSAQKIFPWAHRAM